MLAAQLSVTFEPIVLIKNTSKTAETARLVVSKLYETFWEDGLTTNWPSASLNLTKNWEKWPWRSFFRGCFPKSVANSMTVTKYTVQNIETKKVKNGQETFAERHIILYMKREIIDFSVILSMEKTSKGLSQRVPYWGHGGEGEGTKRKGLLKDWFYWKWWSIISNVNVPVKEVHTVRTNST